MKQIQKHSNFLELTSTRPDDMLIRKVEERSNSRNRRGRAFSLSEVEAIFSGYIYQGPPPMNRTKAYPFWFWMPLIAYFTGARTNEIAQLDTMDILEIEGCPCIDFCHDDPKAFEAKRVKSKHARQVPIHPRLIELGFLSFVNDQKQAQQKKLLGDGLSYLPPREEDLDHNKEGWAKSASKFFNEAPKGYLVEIGVHRANDGKSLYSFRHTLETNLRNARRDGGTGANQDVINSITGHDDEVDPGKANPIDGTVRRAISGQAETDVAGIHYDSGPNLDQMLTALSLIPMPKAIKRLTSYQVDFVDRFENVLTKSIKSHRQKRPRPL
jgi:integrase